MDFEAKLVYNGTVTTPKGFTAGTICSGVKPDNQPDLGILYSEVPCVAAGVFTAIKIKAAPVFVSQENLQNKKAQAVVINAGCANACTGSQGDKDAAETATLVADKLGVAAEDVADKARIVDGRQPHALIEVIDGKNMGTVIR